MRYREHHEVRTPRDLPEAGVRADDRGVVLIELRNPEADPPDALEVMFDDAEGEPGPCVVYTTDLSRVLSHHPGYNAPWELGRIMEEKDGEGLIANASRAFSVAMDLWEHGTLYHPERYDWPSVRDSGDGWMLDLARECGADYIVSWGPT